MYLYTSLYVVLLFVLLTPGVLLRLPPNGGKLTVAVVHGLVFAVVLHFTYKAVKRLTYEGFKVDEDFEEEEKKY
jgi:hypothetical protein